MAAQGERLFNPTPSSRETDRPHTSESDSPSPPAAPDKKSTFSFLELGALLGKLSIPLGILLVLGVAIWLATGYVLGKVFPEYVVTVQPFEISPEIGNSTSLSGKSASDLVVDILNDAARHAAEFHGTDYYQYVGAGAQPVSLHQAIKVPVQTSYGIELKGISLDNIFHLYDRARYEQWTISGDVIPSPQGLVGRIRLNNADTARSWETPPSAHANPYELVRNATYLMLESAHPELLGQSYLQQAIESRSTKDEQDKYDAAEEFFRRWAIDDPQNWKPSYYLSLAYSYQGKAQEASNLASWSQKILLDQASGRSKTSLRSAGSVATIVASLAQTTKFAFDTRDTSDTQDVVITLAHAESKLKQLLKDQPTNVDYQIQLAKVLDKEALVELDRNPARAYALSTEAIDNLDKAIESVPENGGLHEQHAILLMDLVRIMKKQRKGLQEIEDKEREETKEYIRALELRPTEDSALWGAVYAQIDLGNGEEAIDLARTITLLQPGCKAANAAYIVALERSIKSPATETERDNEVELRLNQFLQSKPDKSQLLAVLDALLTHDNQKRVDLVLAEGERHFPKDADFEQRKLQAMSSLLHIPIKPEASDVSCCQLIETKVRDDKLRAGFSLHLRLPTG